MAKANIAELQAENEALKVKLLRCTCSGDNSNKHRSIQLSFKNSFNLFPVASLNNNLTSHSEPKSEHPRCPVDLVYGLTLHNQTCVRVPHRQTLALYCRAVDKMHRSSLKTAPTFLETQLPRHLLRLHPLIIQDFAHPTGQPLPTPQLTPIRGKELLSTIEISLAKKLMKQMSCENPGITGRTRVRDRRHQPLLVLFSF
jgi:hypothetical protein